MNTQRRFLLAAALFFATGLAEPEAQAQAFQVVVNKKSDIDALTRKQVQRLFLKKETKLAFGKTAEPADQKLGSKVRAAFSKTIIGRNPKAVASYWRKRGLESKVLPPAIKDDDASVLGFVASNPSAIGYVSASADTSKVKVVKIDLTRPTAAGKSGRVLVVSPVVSGTIYVNNKAYGASPQLIKNVPPGKVLVEIRAGGSVLRSATVRLRAGATRRVQFR